MRVGKLGEGKLDQLWFDLDGAGRVDLIVPKLSPEAEQQLARLAGDGRVDQARAVDPRPGDDAVNGSRSRIARAPGKGKPPAGETARAVRNPSPALQVQRTAGNQTTGALFDAEGPRLQVPTATSGRPERAGEAGVAAPESAPREPARLSRLGGLGDSTAEARAASEPLPAGVRADLEPRLGFDLEGVRIRARPGGRGGRGGSPGAGSHGRPQRRLRPGRVRAGEHARPGADRARAGPRPPAAGSSRAVVQRRRSSGGSTCRASTGRGSSRSRARRRSTSERMVLRLVRPGHGHPPLPPSRCAASLQKELERAGRAVEALERRFTEAARAASEHRYTLGRAGERRADQAHRRGRARLQDGRPRAVVAPLRRRRDGLSAPVERPQRQRRVPSRRGTSSRQRRSGRDTGRGLPGRRRSDAGTRRAYSQVVAAHEFGHMIGLGDEYPLTRDDLASSRRPSRRGRRRSWSAARRASATGS